MTLSAAQLGPFGVRLNEALEPWKTLSLEIVCAAIGAMGYNKLLELIEEEGSEHEVGYSPPWGKLFNPELVPAVDLPYLGQYVGVEIPKKATEEEARKLVKEEQGFQRGTRATIEVAIKKSLSGKQEFSVVERRAANGSEEGYHFWILIYSAGELPSQATLEANVNAVKPGGVFYTIIIGSLTYAIAEGAHTLYSESESAHTTYADLEASPSK